MPRGNRLHVVIAGGGVAALETLLALKALAGHLVEITLVSRTREFLYRPVTVAEAFDRAQARVYDLAEILADQGGGELILDTLADVETRSRIAVTAGGRRISFDALVVATGAVPGAPFPGAFTFGGRDDVPVLRGLLHDLTTGRAGSVALALQSERMWPLPLYELALMTAAYLNEHGAGDVKVTLVTPEEEPLELFGPVATGAVRSLLEARRIIVRSSSLPAVARGRVLLLAGGAEVFADRVITLPVLEGPGFPDSPTISTASSRSTSSDGSATLSVSSPRATSPRSRSSREVSRLSRPMPSRERSPRWPAPPSRPSRSAPCSADSCSRAARRCTYARSRSGSRARRRWPSKHPGLTGPRATLRRPPGRRCGGLRRRSPAGIWLRTSPQPGRRC